MSMRIGLLGGIFALAMPSLLGAQAASRSSYQDLLAIWNEAQQLSSIPVLEGVPDYSPSMMSARKAVLEGLLERLRAIDPSGWKVPQRVDYLLVRARLDEMDFEHRVTRPWARDPGTYHDLIRRIPFQQTPIPPDDVEAFRKRLQNVPSVLDQARANLSEASGELAQLVIDHMERSDGVGQGEPLRDPPPDGTLGWFEDLLQRLKRHHPDLVGDAQNAFDAASRFRDWLRSDLEGMTAPAAIGLDHYDWYLKNVRLMPYSAAQIRVLGEREIDRAQTFLQIERNKNFKLPELPVASSKEEYDQAVRQAEKQIRALIEQQGLLRIPEETPSQFETDAFWIVRPNGKRHFWEELQYRNPLNNHIHASIPGHRFDSWLQKRGYHPIRSSYQDGGRAEGWAFYLEEMFLQAGLLDELPRVKELFYIAQLARAVRIPAELKLQSGEMGLDEAIQYMVERVPFMEPDLARYDLEIYLRRPTYGQNYVTSKIQMEHLLADRARQQGEDFRLGAFHNDFLSYGMIPISLIRWEMTGLEDEVSAFWQR